MACCRETRACRSLLNEALGVFCSTETKGHSEKIKVLRVLDEFFFFRKNHSCIKYEPVMFKAYSAQMLLFKRSSILYNIRWRMLQVSVCLKELGFYSLFSRFKPAYANHPLSTVRNGIQY